MVFESHNNVFGRTLIPYKLSLTSGGSSGGEAALIAMRGSILGAATDSGGSIRTPALCCGLFGFKPSTCRVPFGGQAIAGRRGSPGLLSAAGPIATSLRDTKYFIYSIMSKEFWKYDSTVIAIPWRNRASKKTLSIGVLAEEPLSPLHPSVARALASAVEKLALAGHKMIFLKDAPSIALSNKLAIDLFTLDNTGTTFSNIVKSGEPLVPSVANFSRVLKRTAPATLEGLFNTNTAKTDYSESWHQLWLQEKIDVIIGPGSETTAVPHDTYGNSPYAMIWNLLDYPAIILPYGRADKKIDLDEKFTGGGSRTYSAEAVDGAPTAIQLVMRTMFDEELLAAAKVNRRC